MLACRGRNCAVHIEASNLVAGLRERFAEHIAGVFCQGENNLHLTAVQVFRELARKADSSGYAGNQISAAK